MIDKESWVSSIENSAAIITEQIGDQAVRAIFEKYNAHDINDLSPCDYSEVFNELYALEADLR